LRKWLLNGTYLNQIIVDILGLTAVALLPLILGPVGLLEALEVHLEQVLEDLIEIQASVVVVLYQQVSNKMIHVKGGKMVTRFPPLWFPFLWFPLLWFDLLDGHCDQPKELRPPVITLVMIIAPVLPSRIVMAVMAILVGGELALFDVDVDCRSDSCGCEGSGDDAYFIMKD
jgi:hypothetical protein